MLLTQDDLETIHNRSKDTALKSFKDHHRIKDAEQEKSFESDLKTKIDPEMSTYEEQTIEKKMKKVAVPILSVASIAGIILGAIVESTILLVGAFLGLLFSLGFPILRPQ